MTACIRRREFITLLGGAVVAWPLAASAQQPAMPVIGYLESRSPDGMTDRLRAFRQGLKDTGYVEGENVRIEYRWAENQVDRLLKLAAELVRQRVNVIATTGGELIALAAKAATMTIPIVFGVSEDPVPYGLVASHSRPGGNATGVNSLVTELGSKQLGLLDELIATAARVGLLVNPKSPITARAMRDVTAAASAIGLQIDVVQASDRRVTPIPRGNRPSTAATFRQIEERVSEANALGRTRRARAPKFVRQLANCTCPLAIYF
jgi:putative tryptophan/tyrosine transport system substrate-binding protein